MQFLILKNLTHLKAFYFRVRTIIHMPHSDGVAGDLEHSSDLLKLVKLRSMEFGGRWNLRDLSTKIKSIKTLLKHFVTCNPTHLAI